MADKRDYYEVLGVDKTADEKEIKKALSPLHFGQPMVENAPIVLTFCADFHRFTQWCELRNANPGYNNVLSFINAASDTLLFVQNFTTLAEDAGLGTCYLGTTVYNPKGIIDILHLPKLVFPIATITVGWPDESPEQTDRLPLNGIIHNDTYKDYSKEDILIWMSISDEVKAFNYRWNDQLSS